MACKQEGKRTQLFFKIKRQKREKRNRRLENDDMGEGKKSG